MTRRRFCAVQAFSLKAKTLAQGEFTSPEQLKETGGAALRAAESKQKDTLFSVSFCLECGIDLDILARANTGHLAGGAFAPYKRFR